MPSTFKEVIAHKESKCTRAVSNLQLKNIDKVPSTSADSSLLMHSRICKLQTADALEFSTYEGGAVKPFANRTLEEP